MAARSTNPIVAEVNQIAGEGPKPVHHVWEAQVHTPNGTLTPFKVLSIDINRDYADNVADEIFLEVAMGIGTYQSQVVPYSSALTVTLKRRSTREGTTAVEFALPIEKQELRATIIGLTSQAVSGNNLYDGHPVAGDLTGIQRVTFQLTDKALEQTTMQSFGAVYRNVTVGDAIKYATVKIAQRINVTKENQIRGVQMTPPNNTKVYSHIVVPHATPSIDVPGYIAHYYGAPYASGFGTFLQNGIWYLYPLYDLTLYDKAPKTLTVIAVNPNVTPLPDRSYRTTQNQVIAIATGDRSHIDPGDKLQLNEGNGTRYAGADQTMDHFVDVKGNKATALRAKNTTEMKAVERPSGFDQITMAGSKITDNVFKEMGLVASRMGALLTLTWNNANPSLIFPGMPCRYIYPVNDQIFELKGIVLKSQTQISPLQPGLIESGYQTTTALTLFLRRTLNWNAASSVTSA